MLSRKRPPRGKGGVFVEYQRVFAVVSVVAFQISAAGGGYLFCARSCLERFHDRDLRHLRVGQRGLCNPVFFVEQQRRGHAPGALFGQGKAFAGRDGAQLRDQNVLGSVLHIRRHGRLKRHLHQLKCIKMADGGHGNVTRRARMHHDRQLHLAQLGQRFVFVQQLQGLARQVTAFEKRQSQVLGESRVGSNGANNLRRWILDQLIQRGVGRKNRLPSCRGRRGGEPFIRSVTPVV